MRVVIVFACLELILSHDSSHFVSDWKTNGIQKVLIFMVLNNQDCFTGFVFFTDLISGSFLVQTHMCL